MANEKILVVDDDKNICELLRLYLAKEGYETSHWPTTARPRWLNLKNCTLTWCCWT